ncbi:DUF814 domain-containing protein [Fundidesulfovibrio butyratiphilus]
MPEYDALLLFSGGLDSILAAKTLMAQGLRVLCLHFVSPFFGHPERLDHWRAAYGLDIVPVAAGQAFVDMMVHRPPHGMGKVLNPCVDCKILMLSRARELLEEYGAKFLATGEVKGQRPMSQRRDALDVIAKRSGAREALLRPLCAKNMKPTPMEESGLVDRERLHDFSGRGRKGQMVLARALDVTEIPQPGGGCRLTDHDSARRFFPVFAHSRRPLVEDFELAGAGRQFWAGPLWMALGRSDADNKILAAKVRPGDLTLDLRDFPSPLAVLRPLDDAVWTDAALADAGAVLASFAPKALSAAGPVVVLASGDGRTREITVTPGRRTATGFAEPSWEALVAGKRALFGPEDTLDDH